MLPSGEWYGLSRTDNRLWVSPGRTDNRMCVSPGWTDNSTYRGWEWSVVTSVKPSKVNNDSGDYQKFSFIPTFVKVGLFCSN